MNIKRILCPIDYSDFSHAANQYASMLAKSTGARIIFLHVFLPDVPFADAPAMVNFQELEKAEVKRLEQIQPTVAGVESSYAVEVGAAADRIVHYANQNDIDLIVMGTHGRSGLRRVLMGSVAESVVRRAECPVLAIKADTRVPQSS